MNNIIFINQSPYFSDIINLFNKNNIEILYDNNYLISKNLNKFSLFIIDFNLLTKENISFFTKNKLQKNVYLFIEAEKKDDIINLLKNGFNNIFLSIKKLEKFVNDLILNNAIKFNTKILSNIINNTSDTIIITDIDGNIIYVNKKFTELTGYTFDEVIGQNPRILKTDYHPDDFYKELWDNISSGKTFECEFKNKKKDGSFYWENARISPIFNDNNDIIYYFSVKKNITKEKNISLNIESHQELINSIYNYSNDYFCIKDKDNKWIFANKNLCSLFGINETNYIDKTDNQIIKFIKKNIDVFNNCINKNNLIIKHPKVCSFNISYKVKNKKNTISFTKKPIFNLDGTLKAIITSGRDITKSISLQEKLKIEKEKAENANNLKSLFVSNISHDLRTPLNSIMGFSNLLLKDNSLPETALKYSKIIKNSSLNILNMINDILDLSKIENNQVTITNKNVNIYLTLLEVFEQNSILVKEKDIEYVFDFKLDKKLTIFSDELRLKQILSNLISNAIKYTNKGIVKISCEIKNNKIFFIVKDTGIGIPKNKQKFVFDRFYQIEDKKIRQYKGTGLGLAISKLLSEKLNGNLYFNSIANKGSEFILELNFDRQVITTEKKDVSESKEFNLKGKNILLVEDDENTILLYKALLKDAKLHIVSDGLNAVKKANTLKNLDLILMDIQLPKLNGIDAVKEIRKFNKKIIIITQTANAMHSNKQSAIKAGSNYFITKPIDEKVLFNIFNNLEKN